MTRQGWDVLNSVESELCWSAQWTSLEQHHKSARRFESGVRHDNTWIVIDIAKLTIKMTKYAGRRLRTSFKVQRQRPWLLIALQKKAKTPRNHYELMVSVHLHIAQNDSSGLARNIDGTINCTIDGTIDSNIDMRISIDLSKPFCGMPDQNWSKMVWTAR